MLLGCHNTFREVPHIESCFVLDGPQYHQRSGPGPLVLPKQAHIHPHPPPSSPPHQRQAGRRGRGRRDVVGVKMGAGGRSGGGQARLGERQERVIIHVPPLTSEEKLQANIAIEKQRYVSVLVAHPGSITIRTG